MLDLRYNTEAEYSGANTDMMLSAPRQAVLLAGGAAFGSTDRMDTNWRYDACPTCDGRKKRGSTRCRTCQWGTDHQRFWANVDKTPTCWLWTARRSTTGYGRIRLAGRGVQAHRVSYEWVIGPIPDGLELDHLCRNRACVRPDHLEPVTQAENKRRGYSPSGINARKSRCAQGHPLDGAVKDGEHVYRRCLVCQRESVRKYKARKAADR